MKNYIKSNFPNFKRYLKYNFAAFAVLAIILNLTLLVYFDIKNRATEQLDQIFELRTDLVRSTIETRILDYFQILKGAKGLYIASDSVSREDWKSYYDALDPKENFPGIQGLGFAKYINDTAELNELELLVRAEGFPEYKIVPEGTRPAYTPIIFLEPFMDRNVRAFGYDMFSDETRRKAMGKARDTGKPVISGKVTLVQETDKDIQAGFLLYLPVYKGGIEPNTIEERRALLKGFVFNPFRAGDLISSILKNDFPYLDVEIYDGEELSEAALLYNKEGGMDYFSKERQGKDKLLTLEIGGRTWSMYITSLQGFNYYWNERRPTLILFSGSLIAFLSCVLILIWLKTQKSNRIKQTITDNATAALFMMDANGYCTFMNPAAEKMTGYSFEEIRKKPLHDMIHHSYPDGSHFPMSECPIDRTLPTNNDMRKHEDVFIKKNGEFFYVSCAARPIFENKIPVSTIIEVRDITEEKMNQQAILESEARFRNMADNAPVMIWITDKSSQCTYVNKQWCEFTGQTYDEALGVGWQKAVHPDDVQEAYQNFLQAEKSQEVFNIDFRIMRHDGKYRWTFSTGTPRINTNGKFLGYIGSIIDISDRKEAEWKLKDTNKELVRINNDLDNFIYTASHDLKAPISNIEGLTTALNKKIIGNNGADVDEILKMIGVSISRFKSTIQDLTDISKIQKNVVEDVGELDIEEIIEEVKNYLKLMIDESNANVRVNLGHKSSINFSRSYLKSIIYNLLSNAIKYRSPERTPDILISTEEQGQFIVLKVKDNGLGLTEYQQEKVFAMFKRLHTHVEGTGIGLYIIKRMIENYGGKIYLEGKENEGSVFSVYFPKKLVNNPVL